MRSGTGTVTGTAASRIAPVLLVITALVLASCDARVSPSASVAGPAPIVACMALPKAECEPLGQDLLAVLGAQAKRITRMEIGPAEGAGEVQPRSLAGARSVTVMLEFKDIPPAWLDIDPGTKPPTILRTQPSEIEPATPTSRRVEGPGPHRVSLGTCGLAAGVDFDGSWWDPIGEVDALAPEASGPALGAVTLTSPDVATFVTDTGFRIDIVRHVGQKWLAGCG